MPEHEIVWSLDWDVIRGEAICHAAEDADCRLTCNHGCEEFGFERDAKGPFHMVYEGGRDETLAQNSAGVSESVRHDLVPMNGECNVCLFLNDDPGLLPELHTNRTRHEIGRMSIEPIWTGDGYEYEVADDDA